ncbi:conserved hypothetical protein, partial [Ricinus communis]
EARALPPGVLEVIVSDNCSTDTTPEVVASAQSQGLNIRYIRNKVDIGSDANIAQCFNEAFGHYVQIMGDDDLYVKGTLSYLIDHLQKAEYGIVCLRPFGYEADPDKEYPRGGDARIETYDKVGDFLAAIGPYITFISACIINKRVQEDIDARQFCGSNLVQVQRNVYLKRYILACKRANSGGYDFFGSVRRTPRAYPRFVSPRRPHAGSNRSIRNTDAEVLPSIQPRAPAARTPRRSARDLQPLFRALRQPAPRTAICDAARTSRSTNSVAGKWARHGPLHERTMHRRIPLRPDVRASNCEQTMSHKNLEIERLRAVAVLLTILVHAPFKQLFNPYLYSSFTGVDLFFVISGFVVSQSLLATLPKNLGETPVQRLESSRQPIIAFYLRRVFRIAPSAFFYILLYWVVAYVMKATGSVALLARPADIFREGIAFAGGIYNYAMVYGGIPTNMSHYYSLSIEEHFYLLAPLLLVLCGLTSYRLAACAIGVGLVLFVARPLTAASIADLSHTRFDELLYGVIIALLVDKYRYLPVWQYHTLAGSDVSGESKLVRALRGPGTRALLKTLVGICLCALLALLPGVLNTDILGGTGQFFFSSAAFCGYALVSVALVILASLERGWILNISGLAPVLEYIGGRSYSIYLGHVLLILVYNDLYFRFYEFIPDFFKLTRTGYLIQFAMFMLLVLALAEATYRVVESPCRDFGKRVIRNFMEARA